jgi:integrase/recombinase XerD
MDQFSSYIVANESIDLSKSLLNEDEGVRLSVNKFHSGVIALDQKMRVFPLISKLLSYSLRNNKISRHTAKTYAKNLNYFLIYLKKRKDFQNTHLDQAFLSVSRFVIEEYLAELRIKYKLSTATIRNRDATLQAFIDNPPKNISGWQSVSII